MAEVIVSVADLNVDVSICEQDVVFISSEMGPQGPRGTQVLSGPSNPTTNIGLLGDQYINTTTGFLFGPKTESGWGSGVLLGTGLKISDVAYTHYQTSSSTIWTITHPLEFIPNVIVVDLAGKVIEGDYQYSGDNTITLNFSESVAGAAFLS